MDNNQPIHTKKWLLPISWIYGSIVFIRNKFFDWNIFKREEFEIPVICVGNIAVGGTGKTPHIELLIKILQSKYKVGVLSRGYKRKTKGFLLANQYSTSVEIGDESFQIKKKFPETIVAVDENRRRGIRNMLNMKVPPEVILLDDAFQHRYVTPSYSIVLSDYYRPIYEDKLLPAGRLRESRSHLRKANMIIMTKCPTDLKPIDYRIISHNFNLLSYQDLFFTTINYGNIKPVFEEEDLKEILLSDLKDKEVLLVTGIASPNRLIEKLSTYTDKVQTMTFGDHHFFKSRDIKKIRKKFQSIDSSNKIILVTEKDASRLLASKHIDEILKEYIYYLPIETTVIPEDSIKKFEDKILKHVKEDSRNRELYKKYS